MLSREVATTLVALLSNQSDPLSSIQNEFQTAIPFDERVTSLCALSTLLWNAIIDHYQQIVAAWLIYAEFEDASLEENPFLSTLTHISSTHLSCPNQYSPSLCDLLPIILSGTPLDFLRNLTVPQIVQGAFSAPGSTPKPLSLSSLSDVRGMPIIVQEGPSGPVQDLNDILVGKKKMP